MKHVQGIYFDEHIPKRFVKAFKSQYPYISIFYPNEGDPDTSIASFCRANDIPLVTKDCKDYQKKESKVKLLICMKGKDKHIEKHAEEIVSKIVNILQNFFEGVYVINVDMSGVQVKRL